MKKLICFAVVALLLLGFSARAQKGADTDSPQLLVDDRETVLKIPHDWHLSIYGMTLDYSAKTITIGSAPTVAAPCSVPTVPPITLPANPQPWNPYTCPLGSVCVSR